VGLVLGVLLAFVGGRPKRWWQLGVVLVVLAVFVCASGADPPAVRSALMAALALTGRQLQRCVDLLNLLGAVVMAQLVVYPALLVHPSFVLSTSATMAILVLLPAWTSCLRRCVVVGRPWKRTLADAMALNMAATTGVTLPVALTFGQYSLWSPLANLLVVPIMMAAMLCGLVLLSLGWMLPGAATASAWCATALLGMAEPVVDVAARLTPTWSSSSVTVLAILATVGALWLLASRTWRGLWTRCSLAVLATMIATQIPSPLPTGVYLVRSARGVEVQARDGPQVRRAWIGARHGVPFVRSLHDHMGTGR
jgi:competence protein ComEC